MNHKNLRPSLLNRKLLLLTIVLISTIVWLATEDASLTKEQALALARTKMLAVCNRECPSLGIPTNGLIGPTEMPANKAIIGDFEFVWKSARNIELHIWYANSWPGYESGHSWSRDGTFLTP